MCPAVRPERIAESVLGLDFQRRIIAPLAGVADARSECGELRMGLDLGLRRHPVEPLDPRIHRRNYVVDHGVCSGLGRRREIYRDVDLAYIIRQDSGGELDCALPPRLL